MIDLFSNIEWLIGGVVALLAFVFGIKRSAKKEARKDLEHDQLQDAVERSEAGRKAVETGRASGRTADERLRNNDADW